MSRSLFSLLKRICGTKRKGNHFAGRPQAQKEPYSQFVLFAFASRPVRGHSEREAPPRPRAGGLLVSRIIVRRELKDGTPFGPDAERVVAAALPTSHLQQVCPGGNTCRAQWNWLISRHNWDAPFATRQRLLCLGLDRAAPRCISWLRSACLEASMTRGLVAGGAGSGGVELLT
jgi:hypothetical protein